MHIAGKTKVSFDMTEFHVQRIKAGYPSQAALTRAVGLSGGYLRAVATGLIPPERTRQRIAQVLGVPAEQIWRPVSDKPARRS